MGYIDKILGQKLRIAFLLSGGDTTNKYFRHHAVSSINPGGHWPFTRCSIVLALTSCGKKGYVSFPNLVYITVGLYEVAGALPQMSTKEY